MKNIIKFFMAGLLIFTVASCGDDFLENKQYSTTPPVIESVDDMKALMYGAYIEARSSVYYGRDMIIYGTLRGDIAYNTAASGRFRGTSYYNMIGTDAYARDTFAQIYDIISQLNVIINSDFENEARNAEIQNVKGQALVFRALAHFDLLKLYGQEHTGGTLGIQLMLEYDTEVKAARSTVEESHAQIAADFEAGIALLVESGITSAAKDLINVNAAKGLAARYYLYRGTDAALQKAYDYASDVIASGSYSVVGADLWANSFAQDLTAPNSIFEIAVGPAPANLGTTSIAYMYSNSGYGDINARPEFKATFAATDVRLGVFNGVDVRGKYPAINGSNSIKILRYEEVLLTRAEANLRLGIDPAQATADVNAIVTRRGLPAYESVTLEDVLEQRRKELFFEGHRYWDMLRLGMDIPAYGPTGTLVETLEYDSDPRLAFPIPERELDVNPNVQPNPGY